MENLERIPQFPEEDDGFTHRVVAAPPGAWFLSLASLALLLVAGAAFLG